ncbi:MAG: protein kinase [bacterium]
MSEDRTGQVLEGKYRLVRVLGRGGMGAVYEAEHTVISRRMAVKMLHAELTDSVEVTERFVREAQSASAIGHPNIIDIQDVGKTDEGATFIVMELLEGQSLTALIKRSGKLAPARAVNLTLQLLSGLEAAHRKGIIHRDLKPDNVFLKHDPRQGEQVKILDFGISKVKSSGDPGLGLTKTGAVMGTPYFMAPEQAKGLKDIDERIDLWAVGVMLYQMLTGSLPFPGDTYNAVLANILTEPMVPLTEVASDLPEGLVAVVNRALEKDRSKRYGSVAELTADLKPFGDPSLVIEPPPTAAEALMETVATPAGASVGVSGLEATTAATPTGAAGVSGLDATTAATPAPAPGVSGLEATAATTPAPAFTPEKLPEPETAAAAEPAAAPAEKPPLWKTILWFAVTLPLALLPVLASKGHFNLIFTVFGLPKTLPNALGLVITILVCGGLVGATVAIYRFWARGVWNRWLQGPLFLIFPFIGLLLVLFHYLTFRGQLQSHLQTLHAYSAITAAQAAKISGMFSTSSARFLNAAIFTLILVWLLSTFVLLGYLFLSHRGERTPGSRKRWLALIGGLVALLLVEYGLFFTKTVRAGFQVYILDLTWVLTAVAVIRVREPHGPGYTPGWRILLSGVVAWLATTGALSVAGYIQSYEHVSRMKAPMHDREWLYKVWVNPIIQEGALVILGALLAATVVLVAVCYRSFPLRSRYSGAARTIAVSIALIIITAIPTGILFAAMNDVGQTWLPHKLSSMHPVALKPGAAASFYIDKEPQSLWSGRKALHEALTNKMRRLREEPNLEPVLAGYKECPTILDAALSNKPPRAAARCVTAIEARLYCQGRGMRLPTPREWDAALTSIKPAEAGLPDPARPLQRGPFAEWTMQKVHGTATFELRGTDGVPGAPAKLEPNRFSRHVGFRCVFNFEKK